MHLLSVYGDPALHAFPSYWSGQVSEAFPLSVSYDQGLVIISASNGAQMSGDRGTPIQADVQTVN